MGEKGSPEVGVNHGEASSFVWPEGMVTLENPIKAAGGTPIEKFVTEVWDKYGPMEDEEEPKEGGERAGFHYCGQTFYFGTGGEVVFCNPDEENPVQNDIVRLVGELRDKKDVEDETTEVIGKKPTKSLSDMWNEWAERFDRWSRGE